MAPLSTRSGNRCLKLTQVQAWHAKPEPEVAGSSGTLARCAEAEIRGLHPHARTGSWAAASPYGTEAPRAALVRLHRLVDLYGLRMLTAVRMRACLLWWTISVARSRSPPRLSHILSSTCAIRRNIEARDPRLLDWGRDG